MGSEMCIRDSTWCARSTSTLLRPFGRHKVERCLPNNPHPQQPACLHPGKRTHSGLLCRPPSRTLHATSPPPTLRPNKPLDRTRRGPCRRVAHPVRCAGRTWSQSRIWWLHVLGLLLMPARAMLSFLPCGVVPLLLTFDTSACDALVFAVRCRATRACVRDAAVSLQRVPVRKACYDAGFARAGARARSTCCWGSP